MPTVQRNFMISGEIIIYVYRSSSTYIAGIDSQ